MKKLIVFTFVMIVITGIAYSQSIRVNSPDGKKIWFKGKTCDITWTSNGYVPSGIIINIFRDSIVQSNFVLKLTGSDTGLKSWKIPDNFTSGYYALRIKTADGKIKGDSPKFRISGKLSYHLAGKAYTPGTSTVKNTKTPVATRKPPALPDMIISSITTKRHKPPGSSNDASLPYNYLHVRVKNISEVKAVFPSRSVIVGVYNGSKLLSSYRPSNKVGTKPLTFYPGNTRKYMFPITDYLVGKRKSISLDVRVDPGKVIRESNENNNSQALIYTPPPKKEADLIIEKIISKGPHTRDGFWITIKIKNIGSKKTSSFKYGEKIIGITGTSRSEVTAKSFRSLSAGESKDFKRKIFFGLHVKKGDRISLKIEVDPDNHIPESSENNNTKTWYRKLK